MTCSHQLNCFEIKDNILFNVIVLSASQRECGSVTPSEIKLSFLALRETALKMLIFLTPGGIDKLLISASHLLPQDKLNSCI